MSSSSSYSFFLFLLHLFLIFLLLFLLLPLLHLFLLRLLFLFLLLFLLPVLLLHLPPLTPPSSPPSSYSSSIFTSLLLLILPFSPPHLLLFPSSYSSSPSPNTRIRPSTSFQAAATALFPAPVTNRRSTIPLLIYTGHARTQTHPGGRWGCESISGKLGVKEKDRREIRRQVLRGRGGGRRRQKQVHAAYTPA